MANRRSKDMDNYIQFLIASPMKERFFEICNEQAMNPSEWLRQQVSKFIREFEARTSIEK